MSNKTIAELTAASLPLNGTELLHLVQGGNSRHLAALDLLKQQLGADDQADVRAALGVALRGHIFGLTLSNNVTDAANDIDIAAGEAASDGAASALMILAAGLTKRLDAGWAVGGGNGGLDTGTVAQNTYHVFLIRRSDIDVVDALFSLSPTAPAMPANYDQKRRIGSIVRGSGGIRAFFQRDAEFWWKQPSFDVGIQNPGTSAVLRALTVPTGISVVSIANMVIATGGPEQNELYVSSPFVDDMAPASGASASPGATIASPSTFAGTFAANIATITNTSGEVRTRFRVSSGSTNFRVNTLGWVDQRGRPA